MLSVAGPPSRNSNPSQTADTEARLHLEAWVELPRLSVEAGVRPLSEEAARLPLVALKLSVSQQQHLRLEGQQQQQEEEPPPLESLLHLGVGPPLDRHHPWVVEDLPLVRHRRSVQAALLSDRPPASAVAQAAPLPLENRLRSEADQPLDKPPLWALEGPPLVKRLRSVQAALLLVRHPVLVAQAAVPRHLASHPRWVRLDRPLAKRLPWERARPRLDKLRRWARVAPHLAKRPVWAQVHLQHSVAAGQRSVKRLPWEPLEANSSKTNRQRPHPLRSVAAVHPQQQHPRLQMHHHRLAHVSARPVSRLTHTSMRQAVQAFR